MLIFGHFIRVLDRIFSLKKIETFQEFEKKEIQLKSRINQLEVEKTIELKEKNNLKKKFEERNSRLKEELRKVSKNYNSLKGEYDYLIQRIQRTKKSPDDILYQCKRIESNLQSLNANIELCMHDNYKQTKIVSEDFSKLIRVAKKENFCSKDMETQTFITTANADKYEYECQKGIDIGGLRDPSFLFYNSLNLLNLKNFKMEDAQDPDILRAETMVMIHFYLSQDEDKDFLSYFFSSLLKKFGQKLARIKLTNLRENCFLVSKSKKGFKSRDKYLELFGKFCGVIGYEKLQLEEMKIVRNAYQIFTGLIDSHAKISNSIINFFFKDSVDFENEKVLNLKSLLGKKVKFSKVFEQIENVVQKENYFFGKILKFFLKKILIKKTIESRELDFDLSKLPLIFKGEDTTMKSKNKLFKFLKKLEINYRKVSSKLKAGELSTRYKEKKIQKILKKGKKILNDSVKDEILKEIVSKVMHSEEDEENQESKNLAIFEGVEFLKFRDYILETFFEEELISKLDLQIILDCQTKNFFFFYNFIYSLINPMLKKGNLEDYIEIEISEVLIEYCNALNFQDFRYWHINSKNYSSNMSKIDYFDIEENLTFIKEDRDKEEAILVITESILRNDKEEIYKGLRGGYSKLPDSSSEEVLKEFKEYLKLKYKARNPDILTLWDKKLQRLPIVPHHKISKNSNTSLATINRSERRNAQLLGSITNFKLD